MNHLVRRLVGLAVLVSVSAAAPPTRAAAPAGRYTVKSGTVYDTKTKLTWQQAAPTTTYTQSDAVAYCSSLNLNGTGWRLPTMMELLTLVDYSVAFPGTTIDATAFPNTPASCTWTSTLLGGTGSQARCVDFSQGTATFDTVSNPNAMRCVH